MENKKETGLNLLKIPFSIYQVKDTDGTAEITFARYKRAVKTGIAISTRNYDLVYSGTLDILDKPLMDINEMLETIYVEFNCNHPADFTGYSLSVSDVIVVQHEGKEKAFYCDSFRFQEISGFLDGTSNETASSEKQLECQTRNCAANVSGFCAAGECKGAITCLKDPSKPEQSAEIAAERYRIARAIFDEEFGEDPKDTNANK